MKEQGRRAARLVLKKSARSCRIMKASQPRPAAKVGKGDPPGLPKAVAATLGVAKAEQPGLQPGRDMEGTASPHSAMTSDVGRICWKAQAGAGGVQMTGEVLPWGREWAWRLLATPEAGFNIS